jgi:hypothetical protein
MRPAAPAGPRYPPTAVRPCLATTASAHSGLRLAHALLGGKEGACAPCSCTHASAQAPCPAAARQLSAVGSGRLCCLAMCYCDTDPYKWCMAAAPKSGLVLFIAMMICMMCDHVFTVLCVCMLTCVFCVPMCGHGSAPGLKCAHCCNAHKLRCCTAHKPICVCWLALWSRNSMHDVVWAGCRCLQAVLNARLQRRPLVRRLRRLALHRCLMYGTQGMHTMRPFAVGHNLVGLWHKAAHKTTRLSSKVIR